MNVEIFIVVLIISCIIFVLYFKYTNPDMVYVKSNLDNSYYLVRNVDDKQQAANMLSKLRINTLELSKYLYTHRDDKSNKEYREYIDRLYQRTPDIIFLESTQNSIYTSYSVNKGEQIVFCIRSKDLRNSIHNLNLIMYVVLHELAHVACPIYDNHGPLFQKIFLFLTSNAIKIKLYEKIDFNSKPEKYCGMMITDSII